MPPSTTSTFNPNAQTIIDLALTDVGANGPGGTVDPNLRPHALTVLQLLLKRMDTEGLFTWKVVRRTQTMTGGVASYVLANDVSDIDQPARYTQSASVSASRVEAMSRDDYMELPDRTTPGVPFQYYVEKSLDATGIEVITIFLYPVPPDTGDTLEYAAGLRMLDVTSIAQTLDVPQKFLNAIRWGLAADLAPAYKVPAIRQMELKKSYTEEMAKAIGDDNERGDIQLVPFADSYSYGQWTWGR